MTEFDLAKTDGLHSPDPGANGSSAPTVTEDLGTPGQENTESALREENARFKIALDNLSQALCVFDGSQRLIFANERYAEMYQLPAELLQPGTALCRILECRIANGFYAGESPEAFLRERSAVAVEAFASTTTQTLNDGRVISISHRPTPGGGWVATHDDITELRSAEAALRESEELFSRAFQVSPAACAISSPENGHHYDVNEGWKELLGYTREDALKNNALSLGIWADPNERKRFVGLLEEHGSHKGFETRFCRKDGTIIDVLVSGVYVEFKGESRLFVVYDDITKRKRAERLSAQQAASMSLMKSVALTANQSSDLKSALDLCLSQICKFMRWEVGHVYIPLEDGSGALGSSDCWFLADEERFRPFREATERHPCSPGEGQMCCSVLEKGEARWARDIGAGLGPWRAEAAANAGLTGAVAFPIKVRDRVVAILEFYATRPMKPSASLVHILTEAGTQMGRVVERANTEAKLVAHQDHLEELVDKRTAQVAQQARELEAALEKEKGVNAQQRQFVAMVSHEFRTPLTIIDSTAQRLERRADKMPPSEVVERARKVRDAVKRTIVLIESVLNSASLDSGKFKMEVQPCNLRSLVEQVCGRQRDISPHHTITCDLEAVPTEIAGDPNLLEKVFVNLLSNAVKYSPDNPEVSVVGTANADSVILAVRDHGVGIPAKEQPKLFERFFRASTASGIPGTGIGLNLVSQVVELHGGRIDVRSAEGEGSTFIVRLPIAAGAWASVKRDDVGQPPEAAERLRSAS